MSLFIAFEGGDGAGKSTQAELLGARLRKMSRTVVLTRQPGGTPVGTLIRNILLNHDTGALTPRCEALLFAADKAQHVEELIKPALTAGKDVISDRYIDSSIAYQGAGRQLDPHYISKINSWATDEVIPDLTVVLDVDPLIAVTKQSRDRIESEGIEFHQRLREWFLALAAQSPQRYVVIPARCAAPAETAELIWQQIEPLLRPS